MLRIQYFSLTLGITILAGCGRVSSLSAEAQPLGQSDPVIRSRAADDTARFLAGIPGNPGSPFAKLESDDVWKEHRELVDAAWHKADGDLLQGLREFQTRELKAPPMTSAAQNLSTPRMPPPTNARDVVPPAAYAISGYASI